MVSVSGGVSIIGTLGAVVAALQGWQERRRRGGSAPPAGAVEDDSWAELTVGTSRW